MTDGWIKAGRALRIARGKTTVVDAAHAAGVSRGWWQNAEKGFPDSYPKEDKLAAAVRAVGADIDEVFGFVGYDPEPFRATRRPSSRDKLDELGTELAELGAELRSLTVRVAELERQDRSARPASPSHS